MSKKKTKRSHRLIWTGLEVRPETKIEGKIKVSESFWSFSCNCMIHCTGTGSTIKEAMSIMMEDYHQRR